MTRTLCYRRGLAQSYRILIGFQLETIRVAQRESAALDYEGQIAQIRDDEIAGAIRRHDRSAEPSYLHPETWGRATPRLTTQRPPPTRRPSPGKRSPRTTVPDFVRLSNYRGAISSGMNIGMLQKVIALAAWGLLAFVAYATISPIQDRPTLPTSTNFEHLAAFAVLGAMFSLAYPRRLALLCLIVIGSAVLLELLQLLTPDRHGRVPDAIEKMAGGFVGIAVGRAILYFDQAERWFQN